MDRCLTFCEASQTKMEERCDFASILPETCDCTECGAFDLITDIYACVQECQAAKPECQTGLYCRKAGRELCEACFEGAYGRRKRGGKGEKKGKKGRRGLEEEEEEADKEECLAECKLANSPALDTCFVQEEEQA